VLASAEKVCDGEGVLDGDGDAVAAAGAEEAQLTG